MSANEPDRPTTRRRLLGAVALAGPGFALAGLGGGAAAQQDPTSPPEPNASPAAAPGQEVGRAAAPKWTFIVTDVADPYRGKVQQPTTRPPGSRYVAADVTIDNASDLPLGYYLGLIRLRDFAGVEYAAGSALGTEPALNGRTLGPREKARGWVWFTVPEGTRLWQLVFIAPSPEFRIALSAKNR